MENKLQKFFNEYTAECQFSACLRPETIRGYKAVFGLFLKIMPEVTSLEYLTPEMLNEFFKRIETRQRVVGKSLKSGVKKSTIKTQWSKLNVFFKWLYQKNLINENPLNKIKPPSVTYEDYRRLEDSEVNKIYSAITLLSNNSFIQRRDVLIVSLFLFCGIRKGEFIKLQVSDIDLIRNNLTVRAETSKSRRTRILKLHPTLILHLKDYFTEKSRLNLKTEYLIASNRGDRGLSREGLKHWVNSLIKKSGVKFHLHMFRHTFACKLAEANVSVFKIQKLMGHTDVKMTMKYMRSLMTEDMGEDVGKISF
jgi:integrase/recombinase XerD